MPASVTIGLPVVNELAEFQLAVRSVFAQTFADWHLIIVCDGSREEIVDTARSITSDKVTVVADGHGRGLPTRLNQISAMSTTPLIARMDADDIMHPARLARQVEYFQEHPDVDLVATASWIINEQTVVLGANTDPGIPRTLSGYLGRTPFCHPSVMFTTEWSKKFPYCTDFPRAEDKELWLRSARASTFARIPDELMFYRIALTRPNDLRKRLAGYATDLRLTRACWQDVGASPFEAVLNQVRVLSRIASLPLTRVPGIRSAIQAQRFIPIQDTELKAANVVLMDVARTHVPGWLGQ